MLPNASPQTAVPPGTIPLSTEPPSTGPPALGLRIWPLPGLPEITAGDDLAELILGAAAGQLRDGDLLVVTSKIVSKAEGRSLLAEDRVVAIERETVRTVATVQTPHGPLAIVENRLGIVAAAAGVDASNVPPGRVLLLPEDPDRTAAELVAEFRRRAGLRLGVLITDTVGRPWRLGHTDIAIGAAGVPLLADERGNADSFGVRLEATIRCVGDELAAAADLVTGKTLGFPVAVVRGLPLPAEGAADPGGARALNRAAETDAFRLGSREAYELGFRAGLASRDAPGTRHAR